MRRSSVDALTARRFGLAEPLDRDALDAARMDALRRTVACAMAGSPWYRDLLGGLDPALLRSAGDLRRIPLLSAGEIAEHGNRMLCVSQSVVARIITLQTSGSTGAPKRLHFTREDLDATSDFFLHGMLSLITREDSVLVLLPFTQPDCTGELLLRALEDGGVRCEGQWPPTDWEALADRAAGGRFTCVVGLPQHLLALAQELPYGRVRSMLLCSDYSPAALRQRIEEACGCETFLHYGTTETGLGGGVECGAHDGCHLRESELLVEIVDPDSGDPLPEGESGEIVVTTLGRQAMPLLRYRTGDLGRLDSSPCDCGGVTARLCDVRGRARACILEGGFGLASQDLDDVLFGIDGLLDYRASLATRGGQERLGIEFLCRSGHEHMQRELVRALERVPAVAAALELGSLGLDPMRRVETFSPSHTAKRTISDIRGSNS